MTAVDPTVVEANGALRMKQGVVELTWRSPANRSIGHVMGLSVSGGGTLRVEKDGAEFASVTEGTSGTFKFNAMNAAAMRFAYESEPGDGYAELRDFTLNVGFMINMR